MNELQERKYIEDDEIDLMEIIKILIDNKITIIVTTLVFTLIVILGGYLYNKKNSAYNTILGFNYLGIEKGLNPNGTQFNKNDLVSTNELNYLFDKYSEKGLKSKDLKSLRQNIEVKGIVPQYITERIEQALKKGETLSYTPTQYSISLKDGNKDIAEELVQDVIAEFNKKYKPQYEISEVSLNNSYDYDDYIVILKEHINRLLLETKGEMKEKFSSKITGVSYIELSRKIQNYENVNLKKYISYIDVYNFSNNALTKKTRLEADIKMLKLEKSKLLGEAEVVKKALDEYKPTTKQLVLPSIGEMGIKLDTENEYYSKLLGKYIELNTLAANKDYEIKYKKQELEEIKTPSSTEDEAIQKIIKNLVTELNKITEEINNLNKEYFDVEYGEMVKKIAPVELKTEGKSVFLYAIVGIVLGAFIGIFIVFIKEFFKSYKLKYNK
ncbi:MAG: Wzz/FepE/Etk N-terminal domain-containing protein [Fusobacterium sp.]|mgnify:FL=1|uniref:Wzz/FepE/Etk N-terminal domain-containing protein n=1 Tax=Fusobacterium sp. TaxID=68766 RepID=UPI002941D003|nr:Wzz/FepE/Etk N-terminal domain-containing protein [Fusobacterium sp.]MDY3059391.1 Wzz/FepE/Etk N-terminal domain-containing protein [Fusobacterium sp.]MEE1477253.1 Wzz/FepE/Etk N-terminal domain-containing protein [Fusobacterium sp.]